MFLTLFLLIVLFLDVHPVDFWLDRLTALLHRGTPGGDGNECIKLPKMVFIIDAFKLLALLQIEVKVLFFDLLLVGHVKDLLHLWFAALLLQNRFGEPIPVLLGLPFVVMGLKTLSRRKTHVRIPEDGLSTIFNVMEQIFAFLFLEARIILDLSVQLGKWLLIALKFGLVEVVLTVLEWPVGRRGNIAVVFVLPHQIFARTKPGKLTFITITYFRPWSAVMLATATVENLYINRTISGTELSLWYLMAVGFELQVSGDVSCYTKVLVLCCRMIQVWVY